DRVITRSDVDAYAERVGVAASAPDAQQPSAPLAAPAAPSGERAQTRVPVRGVRKATAQAIVRSAFTAPHVTTCHTGDVTVSMELRDQLRADRSLAGHRIGPPV